METELAPNKQEGKENVEVAALFIAGCRHCSGDLVIYRVFSKGRNAVGPSKSLIFWTFYDVLGFFRSFKMGDFSFWYFWNI